MKMKHLFLLSICAGAISSTFGFVAGTRAERARPRPCHHADIRPVSTETPRRGMTILYADESTVYFDEGDGVVQSRDLSYVAGILKFGGGPWSLVQLPPKDRADLVKEARVEGRLKRLEALGGKASR